ncbi:MAG: hypothetical protein H0V61_03120 [Chitinophagales bacterium]|nr:hypothetical protein [Chitinophagales bacterium]
MLTANEIFFVIIYSIVFCYLILKVPFFSRFELSPRWIAGIFLLKVMAGGAYGIIHYYLYEGGDTFEYFKDSQVIVKSIKADGIWMYLQLVFGISDPNPAASIVPYKDAMSYFTNMNSYFIVRFNALADLFTFSHYYANMVIYNFFTLIGLLYLLRFLSEANPEKKKFFTGILFLFPSIVFWTSGIHKDGIAVAAIGFILWFSAEIKKRYSLSPVLTTNKLWPFIGLCFGIWLLAIVRIHLLILLMPCMIGYHLIKSSSKHSSLKFILIIIVFYLAILNLKFLNRDWDLKDQMAMQQEEFYKQSTNADTLNLMEFDKGATGFLILILQALRNCLTQPLLWQVSSFLQIIPALDNIFIVLLFLTALRFYKKNSHSEHLFFLFSLFFSASVFVFVGSIVPIVGALVRYKMPGLLFLALALITIIDARKIQSFFKKQ